MTLNESNAADRRGLDPPVSRFDSEMPLARPKSNRAKREVAGPHDRDWLFLDGIADRAIAEGQTFVEVRATALRALLDGVGRDRPRYTTSAIDPRGRTIYFDDLVKDGETVEVGGRRMVVVYDPAAPDWFARSRA